MIRGKFLTSMDDVTPVVDIRRRVFVDEQGFSPETEIDDMDKMAVYALVYDESDRPAGTGRLAVDRQSRFQIGRVCVLKEARGAGLGDLVMRMLLYRAQETGAARVHVEAQLPVVDFYARYGFRPYGGVLYEEGVAHRMMAVEAGEINLEGSCRARACANCEKTCEVCEARQARETCETRETCQAREACGAPGGEA